jgi:hypothetical protein
LFVAAVARSEPIECQLIGIPDGARPRLRRAVDVIFDTTATHEESSADGQGRRHGDQ